jgi:hypothetical protein
MNFFDKKRNSVFLGEKCGENEIKDWEKIENITKK